MGENSEVYEIAKAFIVQKGSDEPIEFNPIPVHFGTMNCSLDATTTGFSNTYELSFDVKLSPKETQKLKAMFKRRMPRKLKKRIKTCMRKHHIPAKRSPYEVLAFYKHLFLTKGLQGNCSQ